MPELLRHLLRDTGHHHSPEGGGGGSGGGSSGGREGGRESLFSVADGAQEGEKKEKKKIKRKRWFLEWGGVRDLSRCDSSESSHGRKEKKKIPLDL